MAHLPSRSGPDHSKAVSVRPFGIHKFSEVIERIRLTDLGDPAILDLRRIRFIYPSLLVLLRAYIDLLQRGDERLGLAPRAVVALPPQSVGARSYLRAMNLYGQILPTNEETAGEDQHLPLQALRPMTDTDEPASRLKKIILQRLPCRPDINQPSLGAALGTTLAELFENFARHAESGRIGWVCAQYYRGRTYAENKARPRTRSDAIEIAVADTGIGIEESLSAVAEHKQQILSGANACSLATKLGVTGKPGRHSGYGLHVARRLCERNGGVFKLASGRHWFRSDCGRSEEGTLQSIWPGTFVALRLSLQRELDVNKIYDEMEPLEVLK